jgi:hypothetical protein
MAEVRPPQPVALIMGVILADTALLPELETELTRRLGKIDARSEIYDFEITDYYRDEMGEGLKRVFYAFRDLVSPESIADIKLAAIDIEQAFGQAGRRRVNLDPGYLDHYKLVLVSAKFQGQKICVGKGVYADPTLYYDKGWKPYAWGFPDFKSGKYDDFLTQVRTRYKDRIRSLESRDLPGGRSL